MSEPRMIRANKFLFFLDLCYFIIMYDDDRVTDANTREFNMDKAREVISSLDGVQIGWYLAMRMVSFKPARTTRMEFRNDEMQRNQFLTMMRQFMRQMVQMNPLKEIDAGLILDFMIDNTKPPNHREFNQSMMALFNAIAIEKIVEDDFRL